MPVKTPRRLSSRPLSWQKQLSQHPLTRGVSSNHLGVGYLGPADTEATPTRYGGCLEESVARGVLTKGRKHRSRPGLVAQAPPQGLLGWEEGATSRQRAREGAAWGPLTGAEAWRGGCSQPWETPGRTLLLPPSSAGLR